MHFPSMALIAAVLMACSSVATGYSFAPALFSLPASGGALCTNSEASCCLARTSRARRGVSSGSLSALSMMAGDERMAKAQAIEVFAKEMKELDDRVREMKQDIRVLQQKLEGLRTHRAVKQLCDPRRVFANEMKVLDDRGLELNEEIRVLQQKLENLRTHRAEKQLRDPRRE
ncbi:hypothetical protein T484DRAFT_1836611 [Baffinella frigidus]|nr:hypothetical protein T484DRAFT_1836611 [Cryptophyta sp. CCMP2293]